jgi:hypothetical protein
MIVDNIIPDYASESTGEIKVVISYFKGVDSKVIEQDLATLIY